MSSNPLHRLRQWPHPWLILVTVLLTVTLGLQDGHRLSGMNPVAAAIPPATQYQNRTLIAQSTSDQSLLQQGQDYYKAGQFTQAANVWSQAERYFLEQGETLNQAIALSNQALAYRQLGRLGEGATVAQASVDLLETMGELTPQGFRIYGQALNTQGSLYLVQGQTEDALRSWERATIQYQQANYPEGTVKSLLNQAQALRTLGFFSRSSGRISQAQDLLENLSNPKLKAELFRSLGETQRLLGNLKGSADSLNAGVNLTQDPELKARLYLSLGNTQQTIAKQKLTLAKRIGQDIDPIVTYRKTLETYQKIDTASLPTRVRAQLNRLSIFIDIGIETGDWTAVQNLYKLLPSQIEALPKGRLPNFSRLTFAHLLLDVIEQCEKDSFSCPSLDLPSNELKQQVRDLLTIVREQTQELPDPIARSYALGYLGHLDELEGKNADAQLWTEEALGLTNQPSITYQWQWQLGRLSKNKTRALWYYDKAFQEVKKVRNDLSYVSPDARFDFRDRIEPLYREYISLLLPKTQTAGTKSNDSATQLALAQVVIDNLRVAELENFLACGLLDANTTGPLASIQEVADSDQHTAIIYPIILDDRLEVLVRLPKQSSQSKELAQSEPQIKRYPSQPLSTKMLENQLKEFRKELEQPYFSTKRGMPLAKELYESLIYPAEAKGWIDSSIETLVFVLDGAFRNVPMAALYDQRNEEFLIEKYAISVTFGDLEIPKAIPTKEFRMLAAGLSEDPKLLKSKNISEDDIFGPLAYVQNEIAKVTERINGKTTVFSNSDFTEAQVKSTMRLSNYNVVHLATHGEFGFTRDDTYLVAADNVQDGDDGINATRIKLNDFDTLLTTRDLTPLELLTLSACETAKGDDREVLGMAGLAVQTGARTTLATLWSIHDLSTFQLMASFYNKLTNTDLTKAQALQQSQIELLKQGYRPSAWAPYLMVGDWR